MERSQIVRKRAIIIGCPQAQGTVYLRGVPVDLFYFKEFLYSTRSGCYFNNEVIELPNATVDQVRAALNGPSVDYLTVYFSGHGYTDRYSGRRMICLRDGNIADTELLNTSRIQLVLIDACRNYSAQISGLPQYGDPLDGVVLRSEYSRATFDNHIRSANAGKMIVHATQRGCVSYDTNDGGIFTSKLLQISGEVTKNKPYAPIAFSEMLPHVRRGIKEAGYNQWPEIAGVTPGYNLPFILDVPNNEEEYWERINTVKAQQRPKSNTNIAWGIAAVAAIAMAADSKRQGNI